MVAVIVQSFSPGWDMTTLIAMGLIVALSCAAPDSFTPWMRRLVAWWSRRSDNQKAALAVLTSMSTGFALAIILWHCDPWWWCWPA